MFYTTEQSLKCIRNYARKNGFRMAANILKLSGYTLQDSLRILLSTKERQ